MAEGNATVLYCVKSVKTNAQAAQVQISAEMACMFLFGRKLGRIDDEKGAKTNSEKGQKYSKFPEKSDL